jgi:hypothetical protein
MVVMALITTVMTSPLLGLLLESGAAAYADLDGFDPDTHNRTEVPQTPRPPRLRQLR